MIINFFKDIRIKARKHWLFLNAILVFIMIAFEIIGGTQIWSFLLISIIYTFVSLKFDMVFNRKDVLRFFLSLWIILSFLIFLSLIREVEIISVKIISKILYNFLIIDVAVVLFLGIAILLFGVIPILLLKRLDKKYNRVFYDINQSMLYIYQHLDESIVKKVSKEKIKQFLVFIFKKHKNSKNITINEEIIKQFYNLTNKEIREILDLEKEYMKTMRITRRKRLDEED